MSNRNGTSGNDTLEDVSGVDTLAGGLGDDKYVVHNRNTFIDDSGGNDSGVIYTDFYKTNQSVENWTWAPGVQKLPYWIDALTPDDAARTPTLLGASKVFYFTFPTSVPAQAFSDDAYGFYPFTEQQKAFVRQAFTYIASVIDVQFVESNDAAGLNTMMFANNLQINSAGYAYYPSVEAGGSDVYLNYADDSADNLTPAEGDYSALTFIHEIGHALGLKHTFGGTDATGNAGEGPFLPVAEDSTEWSVMSYTTRPSEYHLKYSPMDIAALQYLYGPSKLQQSNDVYLLREDNANFIWDGGGKDTIDGTALTKAITLYMEAGRWGYAGGKSSFISAPGQITIDIGTEIEDAIGGHGGDTIIGNALSNHISGMLGNDSMDGAGGNDVIDGGSGTDTVVLHGKRSDFTMTKIATGYVMTDKVGTMGVDTLTNVERIQFDDTMLALDADGAGGQAYRLYQAAFNRMPDLPGLGFWISHMDKGMSLDEVASHFEESQEFIALYGTNPSNTQFVMSMYQNALHRQPEPAGLIFWVDHLDHGHLSRSEVLKNFSESAENIAQVVGSIQNGIEYTFWG